MIFRIRVTTKSDGIRNQVYSESKSLPEARRMLTEAKGLHDYAYIMMEDDQ